MDEALQQLALLKFNKERVSISRRTREAVRNLQREYAARAGSFVGYSGQQEATIGRLQINGSEEIVRALHQTWVDLLTKRHGHISRSDSALIASKVEDYAHTTKSHLCIAFRMQRKGPTVSSLTQEASRQMDSIATTLRTDLEIAVREHEAFSKKVPQNVSIAPVHTNIDEKENDSMKSAEQESNAPRAFISYSWDGEEHEEWVKKLAERLQGESGVEVKFDQWHLNPGDDKNHFMEQGVSNSDFVVMVCTPNYKRKADDRKGGAGYESMVITTELAQDILKSKFIPVLRKGDWDSSLPIYVKSKAAVNLTGEPYSEKEYEKLIRVLHGEPIQPPPIAGKPNFSKPPESKVLSASVTEKDQLSPESSQTVASCSFSPRALIFSPELSVRVFPTVHESNWSEKIELSVVANDSENSLFSRFRGHKDHLVIAYGFDVAVAKVNSLTRTTSEGVSIWKINLEPTRTEFCNEMEMGTSSTSSDEFAEKRVRRLHLNENPKALKSDKEDTLGLMNEAMFENLVQGLNSIVKIEQSSFIDLHNTFGADIKKFIEIAWIAAVADLKLSAAVEQIEHLRLTLDQNILNVDFSGRRHRKYVNVFPYEIKVNGSLNFS